MNDNETTENERGRTNFGSFPVTQSPASERPRWQAVQSAIEDHRSGPAAPVRLAPERVQPGGYDR